MLWLYLLAVVLLGLVVAALLGRWEGAAVPGEESDLDGSGVDELLRLRAGARITADDLQEVRLDSAVRGYRMDQVDRLLDALGKQLHDLQLERPPMQHQASISQTMPEADTSVARMTADEDPEGQAHGPADKDLSAPRQDHPKRGTSGVE